MSGPRPEGEPLRRRRRPEPEGRVFDVDDLLSIVELAEHLRDPARLPLEDEGRPLPIRVSVGSADGEVYAAHVLVEPNGATTVDFTPERRQP